jgi:hypothetical protein
MAKNNLDPLVDKFLARSRRRRRQPDLTASGVKHLTSTPNITGTRSSFRPVKQGTFQPAKRSRKTGY